MQGPTRPLPSACRLPVPQLSGNLFRMVRTFRLRSMRPCRITSNAARRPENRTPRQRRRAAAPIVSRFSSTASSTGFVRKPPAKAGRFAFFPRSFLIPETVLPDTADHSRRIRAEACSPASSGFVSRLGGMDAGFQALPHNGAASVHPETQVTLNEPTT